MSAPAALLGGGGGNGGGDGGQMLLQSIVLRVEDQVFLQDKGSLGRLFAWHRHGSEDPEKGDSGLVMVVYDVFKCGLGVCLVCFGL